MNVKTSIVWSAWHVPTETWHTHHEVRSFRARHRRYALAKAKDYAKAMTFYPNRADNAEWIVSAEVRIDE